MQATTIDSVPWTPPDDAEATASQQTMTSATAKATALRRAHGLGYFSIALGAAELVVPDVVCAASGVGVSPTRRALTRACGVREIAAGVAILAAATPRRGVWARVVGDVLDLALLGAALFAPGSKPLRVANTLANVAAVTAVDLKTAQALSRPTAAEKKCVTVRGDPEIVRTLWQKIGGGIDGTIAFRRAVGGGATVVEASVTEDVDGAARALRAFKQRVEIGEVTHSDASIHKHMHAAQPAADDEDIEVNS